MSATTDSDRRRHPRIILKAFGFKTKCQFTVESAKTDVTLIDLSPGGARLKTVVGATPPGKGTQLILDTMLPNTRQPLGHLAATVCWTNNDEFGVAFNPELEISTAELQALIDART